MVIEIGTRSRNAMGFQTQRWYGRYLGWSSSGFGFSFRKLPGFQLNLTGWLTAMEEDDEGYPCIFASPPFNLIRPIKCKKLKHSILSKQTTWGRFVTINSWKVHLGFLECWSNNELAQSFCVGFSFFNLERVPEADYIGKVTIISWKMGADCRHAGLPEVLDLFNSERLHLV